MDVRMDGQYSTEAAFRVMQLISRCLDLNLKRRPSMKQAVEELKEIEILKDESHGNHLTSDDIKFDTSI